MQHIPHPESAVAVIGMAGRFPGADDVRTLWANLRAGVDVSRAFAPEELEWPTPEAVSNDPAFVSSGYILDNIWDFDSEFFGYTPRQAAIADPQQRLLLEVAWQALEDSGHAGRLGEEHVGVFASGNFNLHALRTGAGVCITDPGRYMEFILGNDKDYLASQIAYHCNLTGPAINIQTACSSSLVSTALACQCLLAGQCDMALVAASAIRPEQKVGYLAGGEGGFSIDGRCRAFDAKASGMIDGNGVAAVVLKRLDEALTDGDRIMAVILGYGLNNDGGDKVGFSAPSVGGQARAINDALDMSGLDPLLIGYIETHGAGTPLGDPIEITALARNYALGRRGGRAVALGSIKTNLGHLDAAAGLAGLIKTTLCLKKGELPPSLHFERLNPAMDLDATPFYVNAALRPWRPERGRYAAVSAFGLGGNNAHLIMADAPEPAPRQMPPDQAHLLPFSAKSPKALEEMAENLASTLEGPDAPELADAAHTLQVGRKPFAARAAVTATSAAGAADAMRSKKWLHGDGRASRVMFMFPGVGLFRPDAGVKLYQREETFRQAVDQSAQALARLRPQWPAFTDVLMPGPARAQWAEELFRQPQFAMAATLIPALATARLLLDWGVRPQAVMGHSLGQYAAACLAGVFDLEQVLSLTLKRAELIEGAPPGGMLAVRATEDAVSRFMEGSLALAAVNSQGFCLVSGPLREVDDLERRLFSEGIDHTRLATNRAGHSPLLEPILPEFARFVDEQNPREANLPILCNLTGQWANPVTLTRGDYWARHLRHTVRFAASLDLLEREGNWTLLEVGPGASLVNSVKNHTQHFGAARALTTLGVQPQTVGRADLLAAVGQLWANGADVTWTKKISHPRARRVSLPTYPFQRQTHRPAPPTTAPSTRPSPEPVADSPLNWCHLAQWRQRPLTRRAAPPSATYWVLADGRGIGASLARSLRRTGARVALIRHGRSSVALAKDQASIAHDDPDAFTRLLDEAHDQNLLPQAVIHLWLPAPPNAKALFDGMETDLELGPFSLLRLIQAFRSRGLEPNFKLLSALSGATSLAGDEPVFPARAAMESFFLTAPLEFPGLGCRMLDLESGAPPALWRERISSELTDLMLETESQSQSLAVWRGRKRWLREYEPLALPPFDGAFLEHDGVYLILGGFGGIGQTLAATLARQGPVRLALLSRQAPPARPRWGALAAKHGLEHPMSARIRQCLELESMGAEVLPLSADLADARSLRAAMNQIMGQWGRLDGVIHAAGVTGGGLMELQDKAGCRANLDAKLRGMANLHGELSRSKPKFLLLCSSVGAHLGTVGQFDNTMGNLALDAYAHAPKLGYPVMSVDWDYWLEVGMVKALGEQHEQITGQRLEEGLRPQEGAAIFLAALTAGLPQVLVSQRDMEKRKTQDRRAEASKIDMLASARRWTSSTASPRPDLGRPATAATGDLERVLLLLWEEHLGLRGLGVDDSYVELGGDSLRALPLISKIKKIFDVDLPVRALFESAGVAGLARRLAATADEKDRLEQIAALYLELAATPAGRPGEEKIA